MKHRPSFRGARNRRRRARRRRYIGHRVARGPSRRDSRTVQRRAAGHLRHRAAGSDSECVKRQLGRHASDFVRLYMAALQQRGRFLQRHRRRRTARRTPSSRADVGHTIRVRVTASNADGSAQAVSTQTGVVADLGNAPAATSQPTPSGAAVEGQTLTASNGTWNGATPISFTYHWQQCTSACSDINDATCQTYVLAHADVGFTMRYHLVATNAAGKGSIYSNLSSKVVAKGDPPKNITLPVIVGTVAPGNRCKRRPVSGPVRGSSYAYAWLRCDQTGTNCSQISGANNPTYLVGSADSGRSLRTRVTARNSAGSTSADSLAVVVKTAPTGNVVPVTSLTARPDHLLIKDVKFSPSPFSNPGGSITVKVHVVVEDTKKGVSGALVQITGLPNTWVKNPPETPTGSDGWVTLKEGTTKSLPHSGALAMQIRARGPGNSEVDILGGISTRRLVQVTLK